MSFSLLTLATTSFAFGVLISSSNAQTDCSEIITVTDVDFRQSVPCDFFDFPCDILEGDYYFTGFDSQGTPTYTQLETGAFFSVQIDVLDNPQFGVLASTGFTYNGSYFAPGWDHSADVVFIEQCNGNDLFQVEFGALTGATNIIYFPQSNAPYPPLYITAILDDCKGIGLDNQVPTVLPTQAPSAPTNAPVDGITCPNYDGTSYSSCDDDVNCANCQHWGCAECVSGYYKMGLFQRCQSCIENYPGCNECSDWNGCISCNNGYTLGYESTCGDEICQ